MPHTVTEYENNGQLIRFRRSSPNGKEHGGIELLRIWAGYRLTEADPTLNPHHQSILLMPREAQQLFSQLKLTFRPSIFTFIEGYDGLTIKKGARYVQTSWGSFYAFANAVQNEELIFANNAVYYCNRTNSKMT